MFDVVTKAQADLAKADHVFRPGSGYVRMPSLPDGPGPRGNCYPSKPAADGSAHILRAPQGADLKFLWVAKDMSWESVYPQAAHGNRMAHTAEYLSSNGWQYVGPAD